MTIGGSTGIAIVTVDPRDIGEYQEDKGNCQDIVGTYSVLHRKGLLNRKKLT